MRVREHIPLCKPVADGGDIAFSSPSTSWLRTTPTEPVIADAAAASSDLVDDTQFCFCCCDSPYMELVRMKCCKQFIRRKCLLAYLGINSQCCYCRRGIMDIATVMQYPSIDRSQPLRPTPAKSPSNILPERSLTSNNYNLRRQHHCA